MRFGIGKKEMMTYVVEMAVRPVEMHWFPYPTGSLFLDRYPSQRLHETASRRFRAI
jgi:hypothetical protein